jgi:hypothetical protein
MYLVCKVSFQTDSPRAIISPEPYSNKQKTNL